MTKSSESIYLTLILFVKTLFQASFLILLTYLLPVDEYANYISAMTLAIVLASFTTLGANYLLLQQADLKGKIRIYRGYSKLALKASLFLSCMFLLFVNSVFENKFTSSLTLALIAILEIIIVPQLLLFSFYQYSNYKVIYSQVVSVSPLLLKLVAILLCLFFGSNTSLESFVWLYSVLTVFLVMIIISSQPFPEERNEKSPTTISEFVQGVKYCVMHSASFVHAEVDKVFISIWLPLNSAGLYALASRIVHTTLIPITAIYIKLTPELFSLSTDKRALIPQIYKLLSLSMLLGCIFSVLVYFLSDKVMWLFDSQYAGLSEVLSLLSLLCISFKSALLVVLAVLKLPMLRFFLEVSSLLLACVLASYLSTFYSFYGVFVSFFIGDIVVILFSLLVIVYHFF